MAENMQSVIDTIPKINSKKLYCRNNNCPDCKHTTKPSLATYGLQKPGPRGKKKNVPQKHRDNFSPQRQCSPPPPRRHSPSPQRKRSPSPTRSYILPTRPPQLPTHGQRHGSPQTARSMNGSFESRFEVTPPSETDARAEL